MQEIEAKYFHLIAGGGNNGRVNNNSNKGGNTCSR